MPFPHGWNGYDILEAAAGVWELAFAGLLSCRARELGLAFVTGQGRLEALPDPSTPNRKDDSIAAMRRVLDRGRTPFILKWGVLAAGIPLFVLMSLLPALGVVSWQSESAENPAFYIIAGAILWPIAGYLLGLVIWRVLEWRYDALMRRP